MDEVDMRYRSYRLRVSLVRGERGERWTVQIYKHMITVYPAMTVRSLWRGFAVWKAKHWVDKTEYDKQTEQLRRIVR